MPYRDGAGWRGTVMVDGHRLQKKFGTKKEAKDWEARTRKTAPISTPLGCYRLAADYLRHCEAKVVQQTFGKKKRVMRELLAFLAHDIDIRSIQPADINAHLQTIFADRGPVPANEHRENLIAFFNWVRRMYDGYESNPAARVEKYPYEKPQQYTPPQKDVYAVLAVAQGEDRHWFLAYLCTGARKQEINRLKWDDIDFPCSKITLYSRKNRNRILKPSTIPLAKPLKLSLLAWRKTTPFKNSPLVFPSHRRGQERATHRWRKLERLCQDAGVQPFQFHAIRRYVGSYLAEQGEPMRTIQLILRHQNLSHTERYIGGMNVDVAPAMEKILPTDLPTPLKLVK